MEIKEITHFDVIKQENAIRQLLALCIENTYTVEELEPLLREKVNGLIAHLRDGTANVFGAYCEEKLCAFLWGYPFVSVSGPTFHVAYISVFPEFEGMGIAKRLLSTAEIKAKSLGIYSLEVIVSSANDRARKLYCTQEFRIDRYVMMKSLVK